MISRKSIRSQTLILAVGLALGAVAVTCSRPKPRSSTLLSDAGSTVSRILSPTPAFASTGSGDEVTVADIAERAVPSVVNISATRLVKQQRSPFMADPLFREFFGGPGPDIPGERRQRSLGSGVIVSADGVILTNNHVIEHAEEVEVSLSDGRDFEAKVIGADPKSDVAVLRLQGKVSDLQPLSWGDSSSLRLGEVVIAIGNPFGVGQTVTMGIVSAKGRANVGIVDYEDFIQTDAAINPGNSGGALVNMRGELIGINTAILSKSGGYQGIGFAIPAKLAKPVMESLMKDGKVVRGWLGVAIQDLDPDLARGLGLDGDQGGVLISDVGSDTPAEKAGFERGDVIVKMNGKEMRSTGKLRNMVAIAGPGAKVKCEVLRKGKTITLEPVLGELPDKLESAGGEVEASEGVLEGATLGDLSERARKRFNISEKVQKGAVVMAVETGSRAHREGLRPGDVILELNRQTIEGARDFRKLYKSSKGTLLLLVQRQASTLYIAIKP